MVLEKIKKANDIKKLTPTELEILAGEIREFLIEKISETGGHLASNLGVVELTMALHLVFDLPTDKIIWDVGHQSYTHKILTGRQAGFDELRKYGGMSGFPKPGESRCDAFGTGHSSTSISAGLGYARARDILNQDYKVVSVIGDGALTGGMAFEALNNAAEIKKNFIIVLNDNNMSISKNVGGLSNHLNSLRTAEYYNELKEDVNNSLSRIPVYGERIVEKVRKTKSSIKQLIIPGMIYENMGITYLGPVDGHDIAKMTKVFKEASRVEGPVMVHCITQKGRGYMPAERYPSRFHGAEPFDVKTGLPNRKKQKPDYTDIFSKEICHIAKENGRVVAITAAMQDGTGLKRFHRDYPQRFFDVGIAEEHAVTFAAGLAAGGMIPVVAVYSSFLQRAYDQILHDVCIQNLHVVFAIDRAGLVGSDGETHQGIFDLSYLCSIPNMTVMAPKNKWEFADMLRFAVDFQGPVAIRYPRGEAYDGLADMRTPVMYGKSEVLCEEKEICILALGSMVKTALEVCAKLKEKGYVCSLVNARFAKPIDTVTIDYLAKNHDLFVTMEENVASGGFGTQVAAYLQDSGYPCELLQIAIEDEYVEHGNVDILYREVGLDADTVTDKIIAKHMESK